MANSKSKPYYKSEKWLRKKYVSEKKSAAEIAAICGVTESAITKWLMKFGLIKNQRKLKH